MPKILFNVSDDEKRLWVEEAGKQGITLSEWIRRRCSLTAGDQGSSETHVSPGGDSRLASPAVSERQFRGPDLKPSQRKK